MRYLIISSLILTTLLSFSVNPNYETPWYKVALSHLKKEKEYKGIQFFEGTWKEALKESKKTGKPIFMDAYTSWCGPCKMMAKRVFTNENVGNFYNENFINIKMDMEKGEGPVLAKKYGVTAYPTLFFINADGAQIGKSIGFHNTSQIVSIGEQILAAEK